MIARQKAQPPKKKTVKPTTKGSKTPLKPSKPAKKGKAERGLTKKSKPLAKAPADKKKTKSAAVKGPVKGGTKAKAVPAKPAGKKLAKGKEVVAKKGELRPAVVAKAKTSLPTPASRSVKMASPKKIAPLTSVGKKDLGSSRHPLHAGGKPTAQGGREIPSAKSNAILAATKPIKPAKPSKPLAAAHPISAGPPTKPEIVQKIRGIQENREQRKDLAQPPTSRSVLIPHSRAAEQPRDPNKDRLILMVRDPFWLHACWDITRKSVERAKAALAGHWHTARPVLRLLRTDETITTSNTENVYRDIEIHGGVRHWYLEIDAPASTYRILLGYLFGNNRFHELARSNPVTPPIPSSPDSTDDHWADLAKDAERVYALSGGHEDDNTAGELQQMMQEKLKRPIGAPALTQFGSGAEGSLRRMKNFHLDLDAEMVVFGSTHPNALLTVGGEPVPIRSDGSFTARVPLPNNRQVLAATSRSRDGLDEQTIVIAVERNTKVMEPLSSAEPDE